MKYASAPQQKTREGNTFIASISELNASDLSANSLQPLERGPKICTDLNYNILVRPLHATYHCPIIRQSHTNKQTAVSRIISKYLE